jgi:mono/diheme cytochrome c family protein
MMPSRVLAALLFFALIFTGAASRSEATSGYSVAVNYQLQCMGCHRADGSGEPGRVPSLRRTLVQFSLTAEGREFILRVPGVAQSSLSDQETAALLNWMARNLSDVPPPREFVDYTDAEVGRLRHRPLAAVTRVRERLMKFQAN